MQTRPESMLLSLTHLASRRSRLTLWATWLLWIAIFSLVAAIYADMLPRNLIVTRYEWAVQMAQNAVTRVMPFAVYVQALVTLEVLAGATYIGAAITIAWRHAHHAAVVIISACLLLLAVPFGVSSNLDAIRLPSWLTSLIPAAPSLYPPVTMMAMIVLYALLPDGRSLPRPIRWLLGGLVTTLLGVAILREAGLLAPWEVTLSAASWGVLMGSMLLSLSLACGFQVLRLHRTSDPVQRQQSKWIVFGTTVPLTTVIFISVLSALTRWDEAWMYAINGPLMLVSMLCLPLSIVVATFRYRLWDVDRFVSRTLVYLSLTTLVVLIYVGLVGGFSVVFRNERNLLVVVVATGLVALLVQPLYTRLQRAVNRLVYGQRDDPVAVLAHLGQQLEGTLAPEAVVPTLVQIVAASLKLPYVALRLPDGAIAATHGAPQTGCDLATLPLTFQATPVGELLVSARAPGEALSRSDRTLLETIAHQAGPAVHALQINAELQRSRQAIITAREEERRRLRRDLHDGLGPQLASQALTLDAVTRLLTRDPDTAAALLQDLKRQAQDAIYDIRRLVYDLRPPALDDLGLAAAVREQAARHTHAGLVIEVVEATPLPPLPAAVEVAAYRIIQEALTNVVRHAGARRGIVTLRATATTLHVTVADDGCGLADDGRMGVGIVSMRERATELGGVLTLDNQPEGGLMVHAKLPR